MTPVLLSQSPALLRLPEQAVALSRLYGREGLRVGIGTTAWRFRWVFGVGSFVGTELSLRLGGRRVSVGLEDGGALAARTDIARAELPAELRVPYLQAIGAPLWRELEKLTRCALEITDVRTDSSLEATPDCIGFEIEAESAGFLARGFVGPVDSQLERILYQASMRLMPRSRVPDLPVVWTCVVGTTKLPSGEVRALEEHDLIVIDDAVYASNSLECRLAVGPERRYAGRVLMRAGRLHMTELTVKGNARMIESETGATSELTGIEEIPINVRFELAQWQATLGEMSELAAGAVVDLGSPIDQQSISVWVERRCIGKGQLVAIGERLGVRLLSVFGPPAAGPGKPVTNGGGLDAHSAPDGQQVGQNDSRNDDDGGRAAG
jgi:type III secretion protein Q